MLRVGATGIRGGSGWSTAGKDGGSRRLVANCTRVQGSVGSQTTVPARLSACMRTSGVSFRKSAAVLSGPLSGRSAPPVRHAFPPVGSTSKASSVTQRSSMRRRWPESCSFQARKYGAWVTGQARNLSFAGLFAQMGFLIHDRRQQVQRRLRRGGKREGPQAGPLLVPRTVESLRGDQTMCLPDDVARDDLAERDLRRIRKGSLQLLVPHPVGCDATRLVGLL